MLYDIHKGVTNFHNAVGSGDKSLAGTIVIDMLAKAIVRNKAEIYSLLKKYDFLLKDKEYSNEELFELIKKQLANNDFSKDLWKMLLEINGLEVSSYNNSDGSGIFDFIKDNPDIIKQGGSLLGGLFGGGSSSGSTSGGSTPSASSYQTPKANTTDEMLKKLKMYQAMSGTSNSSSSKTLIIVLVSIMGVGLISLLLYLALKKD